MEQRRLRLGDILDDYCPRERRVTNHAVVAMVEEDVKQTRCTTCDAEHAYKGGREPRRRKKDATAVLYREVLAGMPDVDGAPAVAASVAMPLLDSSVEIEEPSIESNGNGDGHDELSAVGDDDVPADEDHDDQPQPRDAEDGPFHRRLIRATLPRPEGQKDPRPIPDFTMRTTGNFRQRAKMRGHAGNGNGTGHGGNGHRGGRRFGGGQTGGRPGFGGPSAGSGRGPSAGSGRGPRGPRKRSR